MVSGPNEHVPNDLADPDAFAFRATVFLLFAAVLIAVLAIVARVGAPDDPDLALALLGVPVVYVGLLAAVWGLREASPWAAPAAIGIMWLWVIEGVIGTLGACVAPPALTSVSIPVGAIAAAVVLWTSAGLRDKRPLTEEQQNTAAIVIAVVAVGMLWPYAIGLLVGGST